MMEFPNPSRIWFLTNMLFLVMITADRVEKVEFGVCKQGEDDIKFTKTFLYQCIQNCRYRKDCESINFHRMTVLCRLHRRNSTHDTCQDPGIIYLAKSIGMLDEPAECFPCQSYQTCRYNSTISEYQCLYTECKPLEGRIIGNKQTVGSHVRHDCDPGYYSVHGTSYRMCQSNGEWSGTSPMCCPNGWHHFENTCYKFEFGTQLTFNDALFHCQQLHEGSNLLFIESESEDAFIKDTLELLDSIVTVPKWQFFWNRITRVGDQWKILGENKTVSWFNWLPTEPNDIYGIENCGCVTFSPHWFAWGWNDISCSQTLVPICEWKQN